MRTSLARIIFIMLGLFSAPLAAETKPSRSQSVEEIRESVGDQPTNVEAFYSLTASFLGFNNAPVKIADSINQDLETSGAFYEDALSRIEEGEQKAAIIQLANAIKTDENNVAAYILLAKTLGQMRIPEGAIYYLREALKRGADPELVFTPLGEALFARNQYVEILQELPLTGLSKNLKTKIRVLHGRAHIGLLEFDKAEKLLLEATRADSQEGSAHIELARLDMLRGNPEAASVHLADIGTIGTTGTSAERIPDYWLIKGELERTAGNYEQANDHYTRALTLEEDHLLALHAAAELNLNNGKITEAQPLVERLAEFYADDLRGLLLQLTLASKLRDFEARDQIIARAERVIEKIDFVQLEDDAYNLILIGRIRHLAGNYDQAVFLLRRSLALKPTNLDAIRLLVTAYLNLQKPASAQSVLDESEAYYKDNVVWWHLSAETAIQQKNFSRARSFLDKVIAQNPQDIPTRLRRATIYASAGEQTLAMRALEQIIDEEPNLQVGITLGNFLLAFNQFDQALTLTQSLEKTFGNSAELHNVTGNAHLGKGNLERARDHFNAALNADPEAIAAMFNLASLDAKQGYFERAEKRLNQVLEINDRHFLAWVQLAGIAERRGQQRDAIRHLQVAQGIRVDIDNGLRLIRLLVSDQRRQEAQDVLLALRVQFPENQEVMATDANLRITNDNVDRAKQIYVSMRNQALQNQSATELVNIAKLQKAIGDIEGAWRSLNAGQKLEPASLLVLVTRAEFKSNDESYSEALEITKEIIRNAPEQAIGYRLQGDNFQLLDQPDKALKAYERGIEETAGSVTLVLRYYSAIRDEKGQKEAVRFLESWVIQNKTNDFSILRALAAGYSQIGSYDKAVTLNEALIKDSANDPALLNNLALLYLRLGDERARSYAEKAYELAPQNYAVMDTLGWVLVNRGEVSLGLTMLRNAISRATNLPEIRYHYAVALNKNGQTDIALKELSTALAYDQPFSGIADAKALYKELRQQPPQRTAN